MRGPFGCVLGGPVGCVLGGPDGEGVLGGSDVPAVGVLADWSDDGSPG